MSYPSTAPRSYQIDVIDQVSRAYRIVFENLQLLGEIALLPFLFMLATELVALLIPAGGLYRGILAGLVHAIAFLVFGAIFIVRWHRFVLLGESVSGGLIPLGWLAFVAAAIKLVALIVVGTIVLMLLADLPPHALTGLLAAIGLLALGLFSLRVSLIFPAAAIERPVGLRTAWDWIDGNFARFFACVLACSVPFAVVQFLVRGVAGILPALTWIVFEAIHLAVWFVAAAVGAALLSHLYRDIVGDA
jgi:hypothetical protein